ncbi:DUF11 domain-containing protein [Litoreibacter halocynthiae]|uniref:DUF11 domain-containing protein n=1 Tax=Litoreibacter halocynthiae TaxID=1242689 RepID=UPI0013C2F63A|nr:DUF11 domain-containing protein [Litoreibacter halocynthiae]
MATVVALTAPLTASAGQETFTVQSVPNFYTMILGDGNGNTITVTGDPTNSNCFSITSAGRVTMFASYPQPLVNNTTACDRSIVMTFTTNGFEMGDVLFADIDDMDGFTSRDSFASNVPGTWSSTTGLGQYSLTSPPGFADEVGRLIASGGVGSFLARDSVNDPTDDQARFVLDTPATTFQIIQDDVQGVRSARMFFTLSPLPVFITDPIVAIDDTSPPIIGSVGGTTSSVLDNDTLAGSPATPTNVTLTPGTAPTPTAGSLTMNPDGTITVAPGTTAGTYTYNYEICETAFSTNCATATATVEVAPADILAADDGYGPSNGLTGDPDVGNAFDNDTLNGDPVVPADITATVLTPATPLAPGAPVPALDPATGTVSVPANTPAGSYTISYEICENLNATNCSDAEITVEVAPADILAADDGYGPSNGLTGDPDVGNAFDNDTLNGDPVVPADITATVLTPATPLAPGAPVPALDPATGTVSVPANTPAGSYTISYEICENLNASSCDDAIVTAVVTQAPIEAVDDTPPPVNGLEGNPEVANAFDNDTLNGDPVDPEDITATVTTPATPIVPGASVPVLDTATGVVSVAPETPAGEYSIVYEICEDLNPTNCDDATVVVTVTEAPIGAEDDTPPPVNGLLGDPEVVNVLDNDTLNDTPVDPSDVSVAVTAPATPVTPGAPVPVLEEATGIVSVPAGTPAGTYEITYDLCENLNPANCDTAVVTVVVDPPEIEAVDNILTTPVDLALPVAGLVNVFDNDTLNGAAFDPSAVTVTPVGALPANFVLNPDGTVDTTAFVPNGIYTFDYQICEVVNPTNCSTATVSVPVESSVPAVSGTVYLDSNGNGAFDAGADETLPNYVVQLLRNGEVVEETVSGPDGEYLLSGFPPNSGYEIIFTDPETGIAVGSIQDLTFEVDTILEDQNQPIDPAGVVYDSSTGLPISGATLQLTDAAGVALPTACLLPGQQPQTTNASGAYGFDVIPGAAPQCPAGETEYQIAITTYPPGYVAAPSALVPPQAGSLDATTCPVDAIPGGSCQLSASLAPPAAGAPTPYYFSFLLEAGDPDVINNHIPLDPIPVVPVAGLTVTKIASVSTARLGDTVTYTITAANANLTAAGPVDLVDSLPPGFLFTPGSATLDGAPVVPTVVANRITVPGVTVPASGNVVLVLQARVTSAAPPGDAVNRARLVDPATGNPLTADGTAIVRIVAEHVFDCADIIGKVFDDKNHNGYQDEGEPGLAGVRVVTVRGVRITTDSFGRYHVPCAELPSDIGSNFTLKLDTNSLPTGYRVTTENPRVIRVTAGKMAKLNFGASISSVIDIDLTAAAFDPTTGKLVDGFEDSVDRLLGAIQRKPSVLRLSYILENDDLKTARARLRGVEKLLRTKWRRVGSYKLNIEQTVKRVQ